MERIKGYLRLLHRDATLVSDAVVSLDAVRVAAWAVGLAVLFGALCGGCACQAVHCLR